MSNPTDPVAERLRQHEQSLLDASLRRNREEVSLLLAEDFREFGSSGRIFDRCEILDELSRETAARIEMSCFEVKMLGEDGALVTYRTSSRAWDDAGGAQPTRDCWRSSIWVRRKAAWQMIFHQGTPCAPV